MKYNRDYNLFQFENDKAFIYKKPDRKNGAGYGPRTCIDTNGNVLFQLPDHGDNDNDYCYCTDFFEHNEATIVSKSFGDKDLEALINDKGEFLTDFVYDWLSFSWNDDLVDCRRDGKCGLLDVKGNEIIPMIYQDICADEHAALAVVCKDEKYGMIDYDGNTIIPFEYEGGQCYTDKFIFKKNGKWGVVDKNNKTLIDFKYDCIYYGETNGIFCVQFNNKWGLVDSENNTIQPFIYDDTEVIADVYALKKDGNYAFYSAADKRFMTDFVYKERDEIEKDKNVLYYDNVYDFIDPFGPQIIDNPSKEFIDEFYYSDLIKVTKNEKYGMADYSGNIVIPIEYRRLGDLREGLIRAQITDGKDGFIDRNNNTIIPFGKYYLHPYSFSCGYVIAYSDKTGEVYIDKNDNILDIKMDEYEK